VHVIGEVGVEGDEGVKGRFNTVAGVVSIALRDGSGVGEGQEVEELAGPMKEIILWNDMK